MFRKRLFRAIAGYLLLLTACSADPSQGSAQEGQARLSQQISQTFDGLARPDGACLSGRLGNDKICETSASWKQTLADTCGARGLQLESATTTESCGSGLFRYADFSCCPTIAPEPVSNCIGLAEGGPSVCKPIAEWKQIIGGACAESGLRLGETFFGESCGPEAARSVKYACCGDQALPSPDTACQALSEGGAGTCKTPEAWKSAVSAQCSSKGLGLGDLTLGDDCGSGNFRTAKFLCCGAGPTPPPEPTCKSAVYPTPECRDEAAWRTLASDICRGQSLQLEAIGFADACGAGVWRSMKYGCCPAKAAPPPVSNCATQLLSEGTCNDQATWRDRAVRACAATGAQLKELTFGTACGSEKYLEAKASCCP